MSSSELTFFEKLRLVEVARRRHADAPSAIVELTNLLDDPDVRREFFNTLDRVDWIMPLRDAGYFDAPRPPVISDEGTNIHCPPWPASAYLARMASQAPSEVAGIFASLQTDNASIIGDLLQAAIEMPPSIAARLVPVVCQSMGGRLLGLVYFKEAADLCLHLAIGNEDSSVMALVDALFDLKYTDGQDRLHGRDKYWYEKGLEKILSVLIERQPREFLLRLCNWLEAIVSELPNVNSESGSDHSFLWRPAIEEHAQNSNYEFAGVMVGFLRNGLEQAIGTDLISLKAALAILDKFHYFVFKRLKLHLINEFGEQVPDLTERTIMDYSLFDDLNFKHEYAMLVGRRLNLLSPSEREKWYEWVDAGPNGIDLDGLSDGERRDHIRYWQFQKLHNVREHLQGERRRFYDEMLAKYGEPKLANLNVHHEFSCGHESPMPVKELVELSFREVIDRVCTWRPVASGSREPDYEGLATAFERYLAIDPERISTQARLLIGRPAIYVRKFFNQMASAIRAGRDIDILSVLDLCDWVLTRPVSERTMPLEAQSSFTDKDWQWTRDEIAEFVQHLCKSNVDDRPKLSMEHFRARLWAMIEELCGNGTGSYIVRDTSSDDPRVCDYLDMGINSPRGKALEGALEYARWIANHIKTTGEEVVPGGFDAMPEVREILNRQIEPDCRSPEAMAVIGAHVNLIHWIDKNWPVENAAKLFDLTGDIKSKPTACGWAAWNAFLVWVHPHIEFFNIFREQYIYAVAQSAQVDVAAQLRDQPMFHLGEHLMVFFGRGLLDLEDEQGLIRRFLEASNSEIRRHAIGFVGRSLQHEERAPDKVVSRFMALWDMYWKNNGKEDAKQQPDALLFGMWFSSGQFPKKWALNRLEDFTKIVPMPTPAYEIMEELAKSCDADIDTSLIILDRIVCSGLQSWQVFGGHNSAPDEILAKAIRAGGVARTLAERIINYLGRRGFIKLGRLLDVG